jgi:uncharacterized membrane protein
MKAISKTFLTGLMTILPIAATMYILYWLVTSAESLASSLLKNIPAFRDWNVFGFGIAVLLVVIFLVGLLMQNWLFRSLFTWGENLLKKIPLVKTLYGSVRDLLGFFGTSNDKPQSQVVMVSLGETNMRLLGLLTRENFDDLPEGVGNQDSVAVYLPMSYQVGGFVTIVPRTAIEPVKLSMEEAMRFAVTAGMTQKSAG